MNRPKMLIIEPDAALAALYAQFFRDAGYGVWIAGHPQDAICMIDEDAPDIVLLELQMIGHNGIEFLYEFRSYSEWKAIPVILLTLVTPHALGITVDMMQALGIARCLYKPATRLAQLHSAVQDVMVARV